MGKNSKAEGTLMHTLSFSTFINHREPILSQNDAALRRQRTSLHQQRTAACACGGSAASTSTTFELFQYKANNNKRAHGSLISHRQLFLCFMYEPVCVLCREKERPAAYWLAVCFSSSTFCFYKVVSPPSSSRGGLLYYLVLVYSMARYVIKTSMLQLGIGIFSNPRS